MSEIVFRPASDRQLARWDDFVFSSINGTLFHSRAFLSYHGDRFAGAERWMVAVKGDDVVAQIVYAIHEEADGRRIALSPYGASYGGFVLAQQPSYSEASGIVEAFLKHLHEESIGGCRLIHPIACCSAFSLDVLTFAMLAQRFCSVFRDISSVIGLTNGQVDEIVYSRARNMARKAQRAGVTIIHSAPLDDFWVPMEATFARHGTRPTHSRKQLEELCVRFPDAIKLDVAYWQGEPVGGICYFQMNRRVMSSFYFCQTSQGQELQSLSLLVLDGLRRIKLEGYQWLDFGTSTSEMRARPNIFRFKESFSRQGMFRETLEWCAP